jgi:renalase
MPRSKIAIIGAGLSGLITAKRLQLQHQVVVYEKSRGVSGRLATRRADPWYFDHGAQHIFPKQPQFRHFIETLIEAGVVVPWHARFVEMDRNKVIAKRQWDENNQHFVGSPGMNAIGKFLAMDCDVRLNTQISKMENEKEQWLLFDEKGSALDCFDWVISTAPVAQTCALMPQTFSHFATLRDIKMQGCNALMLGFDGPLTLDWDAALVHDAIISWISVNSQKPGRAPQGALVIHSTNQWAESMMETSSEAITNALLEELHKLIDIPQPTHATLHRWRYANTAKQNGSPFYLDTQHRLAALGDWCIHGRVEAAFMSASQFCDTFLKST